MRKTLQRCSADTAAASSVLLVYDSFQNAVLKLLQSMFPKNKYVVFTNPLNAELNPICLLLALLGAQHILHVSGVGVKNSTTYFNSHRIS